MNNFNFDEWAELYKRDPVLFELKRKEAIDNLIENAPVKHRNSMRLVQMECDVYRDTMEPTDAARAMLELANQKLSQINIHLTELKNIVNGPRT